MKIGQSLQFLDNMYLNRSTPRNIENFSSYNVTDSGSLMLNTFPLPPIGLHYWQVVFLSTAITLGVPGNLLVIVSYSMNRRKTDCDWYIVYIAVLDLIVCLFRVPTYLSMETGFWQSHATDSLCKAVYWISQSVITASVILFGFIAIDRFIRVCCTTLKVSPRASMTFVGAMSVGSAISAAPTFLMYAQGSRGCVPVATLLGFTMMRIYYTVLFAIFIVMFVIVVITYTLIIIKVRHARKVLNGPTGRKSTENDQAVFSHRLHTAVFMPDCQRKLGPKSATFQTEDDPLDDESSLSRTTTLEKNPTMQPTSTQHPWMTVNNGGKQIWQSFRLVDREDANRNALTVPTNEEWHMHVSGDRFEPRIRCMDRATDPHSRDPVFNVPMDTVNYVRSPGISEKSCKKDFNTPLKLDEVENEVKLPCSLKYNSFVAGRLHNLSEGMPGQRRSRSFVKTLTHFERHNARIKRNARDIQVTMLLLVITVIFVVSWIPPYLAMAWFFYVGYTPPYTVAEVSLMTYAPTGYILNHFASPFVYIALSPTFKKNIINLFLSVPRILQRGT